MLMSKNGWTWVRAQAHYQKFGIGETQLTRYFRLGPEGWVLVTAADALKYAKS